MNIVLIIMILSLGIILTFFSESVIKIFREDQVIDHKKNKYRKIVFGIGLLIASTWQLIEYFFD